MDKIKAIDTDYNGYKFRSRLEARWAVFFDNLNINYEYEKEGFELHNGIKYLPDFYLNEMDIYVEVKPSFDLLTLDEIRKIFYYIDSGNALFLIIGTPTKHNFYILHPNIYNYDEFINQMSDYGESHSKYLESYLMDTESEVDIILSPITKNYTLGYLSNSNLEYHKNNALLKAKMARFEFNKT